MRRTSIMVMASMLCLPGRSASAESISPGTILAMGAPPTSAAAAFTPRREPAVRCSLIPSCVPTGPIEVDPGVFEPGTPDCSARLVKYRMVSGVAQGPLELLAPPAGSLPEFRMRIRFRDVLPAGPTFSVAIPGAPIFLYEGALFTEGGYATAGAAGTVRVPPLGEIPFNTGQAIFGFGLPSPVWSSLAGATIGLREDGAYIRFAQVDGFVKNPKTAHAIGCPCERATISPFGGRTVCKFTGPQPVEFTIPPS